MAILIKRYAIYKNGKFAGYRNAPDEYLARVAHHMDVEKGCLADMTDPQIMNAYEAVEDNPIVPLVFTGFIIYQDPDTILYN